MIKIHAENKIPRMVLTFVLAVLATILLLATMGTVAHATGLVDDMVNAKNLYSKYPLSNYQLDFYVDNSWDWLPWNWADGIGKSVQYGLYCITNFIWTISLYLSNATGYVVQEAYKLNFINDTADSIGKNMQTIAGVTQNGFGNTGFYVGFLLLLILIVGIYVAYTGLIKRETSKALHAAINFLVIFILSASFIAYSPDYVKKINDFSSDISTAALQVGTKIMLPNADNEGKDSVDLIRNSLFAIQVQKPWSLLQYGNADIEKVGADRVEKLLSTSPSKNDGKDREELVKAEIEEKDNGYMTISELTNRLGMVFCLLLFNLGITIFIFLLTAIMIFSQILFIIFAMFLPVSFLLSMIPSYEGMVKQAITRVFNTIMIRAGITLIVTVAFSISSMLYSLSGKYPFFMIAFLQIVTFAGVYFKLGDIMGMFSLNAGDSQNMGRRIFRRPYMYMRQKTRHMERQLAKAVGTKNTAASNTATGDKKAPSPVKQQRETTSSAGSRAGAKVGAAMDMKNHMKSKAVALKENIQAAPTQAGYALYAAKEKTKENAADFKRGIVQEQEMRQAGRTEKRNQQRQNIAAKRMAMQKEQEEIQPTRTPAKQKQPSQRPIVPAPRTPEGIQTTSRQKSAQPISANGEARQNLRTVHTPQQKNYVQKFQSVKHKRIVTSKTKGRNT